MTLRLDEKQAVVAEFSEITANSISAVAADYRGLTVAEMTEMRTEARNSGVHLKVVRNNLLKRAVADTSFACMQDVLVGPLVLAFGKEDPGAPARLLRDFAKKFEKLEIKFLSIDGQLMDGKDINALANLPTRDEALATLMSVMLAPTTKFVRTLSETYAQAVRVMGAVRDQKQAS